MSLQEAKHCSPGNRGILVTSHTPSFGERSEACRAPGTLAFARQPSNPSTVSVLTRFLTSRGAAPPWAALECSCTAHRPWFDGKLAGTLRVDSRSYCLSRPFQRGHGRRVVTGTDAQEERRVRLKPSQAAGPRAGHTCRATVMGDS